MGHVYKRRSPPAARSYGWPVIARSERELSGYTRKHDVPTYSWWVGKRGTPLDLAPPRLDQREHLKLEFLEPLSRQTERDAHEVERKFVASSARPDKLTYLVWIHDARGTRGPCRALAVERVRGTVHTGPQVSLFELR